MDIEDNDAYSDKTNLITVENAETGHVTVQGDSPFDTTPDNVNQTVHVTGVNHSPSRLEQTQTETGNIRRHQQPPTGSDFLKLPKRKLALLAFSTIGRLLMNAAISLFNPIFPLEAEEKGIGGTWMKLTFGALFATIFFTAPIFGRYLSKLGPHFVLVTSLYVGGITNLFFAFLHYGPGGTPYLVLVLLIRCLYAVSRAGFGTVTQAVVFYEFDRHMGIAQSILQGGTILGFVLGPAIAGFLYDAGGYCFPFYATGGALFLHAVFTNIMCPNVDKSISKPNNEVNVSAFKLMKSPLLLVALLCNAIGTIGVSNLDSTLTDVLIPFGLSMWKIGLIFVLMDFVNTSANFFWAYMTDSLKKEDLAILLGLLIYAVGFILLGPAMFRPYIPYELVTICVAVSIIGIAFGGTLIPVMKCMLVAAKELGFDDKNFRVLSEISGLFNSVMMMGGFLGQFVIGLVDNKIGNQKSFSIIALLNLITFIVAAVLFGVRKYRG